MVVHIHSVLYVHGTVHDAGRLGRVNRGRRGLENAEKQQTESVSGDLYARLRPLPDTVPYGIDQGCARMHGERRSN